MNYKAVATCGFGLESVLTFELKKLGVKDIAASDGRVSFSASGADIARANVGLRTAERVLIVLAEYPAATFDELFDGAEAILWKDYIDRKDAFPVKGYCMNSALSSVPACQAVLKKAVAEKLKKQYESSFLPENNRITKRIQFSIVKDVCTVMLDSSGDGLHKRGYRPLTHEAPIKETLAAGIADFARVFPESEVADPFCGSGTLVIEAALRARNIAPGLDRPFAAESYSFLGDSVFAEAKEQARSAVNNDAAFCARGYDIDADAIENAKENARRAGVGDCISFLQADARDFVPKENEIIIANPPYGERLMDESHAERLCAEFTKSIFNYKYKGLYIISSHPEFEKVVGKKASRRRKLYNGMIPCQLYMYF